MGVLASILEAKQREVQDLLAVPSVAHAGPPRTALVTQSLLRPDAAAPLRLVTEIKRRSPSAGPLSTVLSPAERALAYARAGAAMISVLCDRTFFDGGFDHLVLVRRALDDASLAVPLLAKEFVVDPRQLEEAACSGADAVLLIARIVDHVTLRSLVERARSDGLEPVVEVVTEDELSAALDADAKIIGVNARDLDTLAMDAERAARVLAAIPADRVAVHLSGLKAPDDVATIRRTTADAALIGEALMRQDEPSLLLRAMVASASG